MPERCVVARCSSIKDIAKGVSLHAIPYYGDDRPEAKKTVHFLRIFPWWGKGAKGPIACCPALTLEAECNRV